MTRIVHIFPSFRLASPRSGAEALRAAHQLAGRASARAVARRQHAEAAVRLLVDADKVRQDREQVEAGLDPAKCPLRRCQILEEAKTTCGTVSSRSTGGAPGGYVQT
jgi:hypothetical protein